MTIDTTALGVQLFFDPFSNFHVAVITKSDIWNTLSSINAESLSALAALDGFPDSYRRRENF